MRASTINWRAASLPLAMAFVVLGLAACGGNETAASPAAPALLTAAGGTATPPDTGSNGNGPGPCDGSGTCTGPCDGTGECTVNDDPLTAKTVEALNLAIQDEYHAEFVYMRVIEDFGPVQPFSKIVNAEERHSQAIAKVFTNRGLAVPASEWNLGNVPSFGSLADACAAAAKAEVENIALYDELLTWDLPQDARNVFTNLRAASLESHLPAFEACCLCNP